MFLSPITTFGVRQKATKKIKKAAKPVKTGETATRVRKKVVVKTAKPKNAKARIIPQGRSITEKVLSRPNQTPIDIPESQVTIFTDSMGKQKVIRSQQPESLIRVSGNDALLVKAAQHEVEKHKRRWDKVNPDNQPIIKPNANQKDAHRKLVEAQNALGTLQFEMKQTKEKGLPHLLPDFEARIEAARQVLSRAQARWDRVDPGNEMKNYRAKNRYNFQGAYHKLIEAQQALHDLYAEITSRQPKKVVVFDRENLANRVGVTTKALGKLTDAEISQIDREIQKDKLPESITRSSRYQFAILAKELGAQLQASAPSRKEDLEIKHDHVVALPYADVVRLLALNSAMADRSAMAWEIKGAIANNMKQSSYDAQQLARLAEAELRITHEGLHQLAETPGADSAGFDALALKFVTATGKLKAAAANRWTTGKEAAQLLVTHATEAQLRAQTMLTEALTFAQQVSPPKNENKGLT